MGRIDESEQFYLRLLNDSLPLTSVVARDNLTRAQCHIELGNILRIKKQYQQVTEHTNKAGEIIDVMKSVKDDEKILLEIIILLASLLLLYANIARDRGNIDQAKTGTFSAMEHLLSVHKKYGGQESFESIMGCLSDLLQLCIQCTDDDSLFARTQTIWSELPPEFHTDNAAVATIHHQFAICLEKRNLIREALEQAEKVLTIARNVLPSDDSKINEYKQHADTLRRKL
jgi:tetratricopeptide (TPR) repeat protein